MKWERGKGRKDVEDQRGMWQRELVQWKRALQLQKVDPPYNGYDPNTYSTKRKRPATKRISVLRPQVPPNKR